MNNDDRRHQDKPKDVVDYDISTPFDINKSLNKLGGNMSLYIGILTRFEEVSLMNIMESMATHVKN